MFTIYKHSIHFDYKSLYLQYINTQFISIKSLCLLFTIYKHSIHFDYKSLCSQYININSFRLKVYVHCSQYINIQFISIIKVYVHNI